MAPAGVGETGLDGIIEHRLFVGQATRYVVASGGTRIVSLLASRAGAPDLPNGERVRLSWAPADCIILREG